MNLFKKYARDGETTRNCLASQISPPNRFQTESTPIRFTTTVALIARPFEPIIPVQIVVLLFTSPRAKFEKSSIPRTEGKTEKGKRGDNYYMLWKASRPCVYRVCLCLARRGEWNRAPPDLPRRWYNGYPIIH